MWSCSASIRVRTSSSTVRSNNCDDRWCLARFAELPKKSDAQVRLEDYLRPVNQGTGRPEALIAFGTFVGTQWKALVLPTFKRPTQHGYKTVLNLHLLPRWRDWRLRDIEPLAIQQWVAEKFPQRCGWQT